MSEQEETPLWLKSWRDGFAPNFTIDDLLVLQKALTENDPRLIQGASCIPPPVMCVEDWPVECCCPVSWIGAHRHGGVMRLSKYNYNQDGKLVIRPTGSATVGQTQEFFAESCFECDQSLGEAAGCRHFLLFWDDSPREQVVPLLLQEVNEE